MLTFTLDHNCLLALAKQESTAPAVRTLADADKAGNARVAVVAVSASERQGNKSYIQDFSSFQDWLAELDLRHLEILRPIIYLGISFFDWSIFPNDEMTNLEKNIQNVLFPTLEFSWEDYCRAHGWNSNTVIDHRWRNRKCDVQSLWCHIHYLRDVFVTTDHNFLKTKKRSLVVLGAGQISTPKEAAALL